jgi:hypothetical protein
MSRRAIAFLAVLSLAACLICLPAAHAGDVSHARIVRLSYALGDVQISGDGASGGPAQAGWHKAIANTPLREGNALATGDGRAEVEFENGAMVWVASNTVLEFSGLVLEEGGKNTQLAVKQGTATFYVEPGRHDSFVVQAGKLTVAVRENSRFRVDVFDDGAAVSALRGQVEVAAPGGTERLISHQTLALRDGVPDGAVVTGNPKSDSWDKWVSDRYGAVDVARMTATDNWNSPVGFGMADLSFYGGWVTVPGYGLAWQPYGMGLGWSPFYNGYWSSFGAFGPAWISYEPWGWLPYHYGGWMYSPGFGWVWGPGAFGAWSPATAFWTSSPAGIGWVARAPNEVLNGTPANLAHGMVVNTTTGFVAGSRNTVLRGDNIAKAQMTGAWQGEADLGRIPEQSRAQLGMRAAAAGPAKSMASAQKMPQGTAPRIASAGMFAGRAQVYHPPITPRGAAGPYGGRAPAYGGAPGPASAGSAGARGGTAPSHASGGGASAGKP